MTDPPPDPSRKREGRKKKIMVSHSGLITVMERAVRKAAPRLRRDFNEVANLQVSRKGPADFVSVADKRAEETIVEELRHARPDWGMLLEEGGTVEGDPTKPRWIVDPLDGTSNFLHGIPHFCISIAVEDPRGPGGRPEITHGMVYQPLTDEGFWAEKGRGAWVQGNRLRVSGRRELTDCLIATGIPFLGHGNFGEWSRIFGAIAPEVAGIRRFGSAALDLAWVAAGRYDAFWESGLKPWDVAAGLLIVKEAGGYVTDFRGQDRALEKGEVLAANDGLHSRLHKLLANALR
jgi:myo-inositol-1(or 4)-monophosphatase